MQGISGDLQQAVVVQAQGQEAGGQRGHVRQARVAAGEHGQGGAAAQVERQAGDGVAIQ
jgi:hypothetical protein